LKSVQYARADNAEPFMTLTIVSDLSVVFALAAAVLWAWSSAVNLPIVGSGYGAIANLDPFYAALKKVARLNALAATCAFLSAALQAWALYLSR
jgi:hypothetical protein